ncbi:MAG TPA: DUF899 domain-containing protein [Capillimicrobium sp.]|jgi:predicted dithiol-disulfide oxidoreductase (DUF899 family)
MRTQRVVSRSEWLSERLELLEAEKALTRQSDELAERRRALPWVRVEEDYRFVSEAGELTLLDLFAGRSQLLVYQLMYGPGWDAACPGCTFYADHIDGSLAHLAERDVTYACVSGAPIETLLAYKAEHGWSFPWVSAPLEFLRDFSLFTAEQRRTGRGFNFGTPRRADIDLADGEQMGFQAFVRDGDEVFHTYAAFDRGTEALNPTFQLLDRAPLGRGSDS